MNAIDVAITTEKDAINFYNEAALKVKSKIGQNMFFMIAEDEKRHLEMFTNILNGMAVSVYKDLRPIKNIQTIFDQFRDEMTERIAATDDEMEAFRIAMDMEERGIEFYKKAASETSSENEKQLFEQLIREEKDHYAIFSNTYSFMKDTGNWFMWEEHSMLDGGTPWA